MDHRIAAKTEAKSGFSVSIGVWTNRVCGRMSPIWRETSGLMATAFSLEWPDVLAAAAEYDEEGMSISPAKPYPIKLLTNSSKGSTPTMRYILRVASTVLAIAVSLCAVSAAPSIPTMLLNNDDVRVYRRSPTELWVYDIRPELGIGTHGVSNETLDMIRELGIRLVRHTLYWYSMENTTEPGVYAPAYLAAWDNLVQRCQQKGIELEVIVHGNAPGLSFDNRHHAYQRFAQFTATMAARYPTIRFWELWNEMDVGFTDLFGAGRKGPDGQPISMVERGKMYAEMLKVAYPAIKEANPQAWVLTGGMSNTGEFPRGIYLGGGKDYFDIMNIHTYGVPVRNAFVARGLHVYQVMKEFGDENRPLWNTEWGIDAGNLVAAWGWPHERGQDDAEYFDQGHKAQWRAVLEDHWQRPLYQKVLPYQFAADNERNVGGEPQLPEGMTMNDFGFGIVRADGLTPRPTYNWLKELQFNRHINQQPIRTLDVEVYLPDGAHPVGYKFSNKWREGILIIHDVEINSLYPTVIKLELPSG